MKEYGFYEKTVFPVIMAHLTRSACIEGINRLAITSD